MPGLCCDIRRSHLVVAVALAVIIPLVVIRTFGVKEVRPPEKLATPDVYYALPGPNDWPCWRGTGGRNFVSGNLPPLRWSSSSKESNIVWQTAVPGRGHSSPIVWGHQVFLTTSNTSEETVSLLCYGLESGRLIWEKELHRGGLMAIHSKNSHASATPACDGRNVYVPVAIGQSIWVSAVSMNGQISWQQPAATYITIDGFGSSIALHNGLAIVAADNSGSGLSKLVGSSCLTALNCQTGNVVWRIKRPGSDSHGTPIVARISGRTQLVLPGSKAVTSYDPANGEEMWTCRWPATRPASTIAFDETHVIATAKYPKTEIVCIDAAGTGDVTETNVVWRIANFAGDVPSPIIDRGCCYVVGDNGVLVCLDVATGKVLWKRRLSGNFSSSPLIIGEYLYCGNEEGAIYVVRLNETGEVVAENSLDSGCYASPILIGDRLLVRTLNSLYCIKTQAAPIVAENPSESNQR